MMPMRQAAILGSLWGTVVGDALGLPYEGLSAERARRLLGPPDRYRLFFGRGMISDDAEHACLTAEALARSGSDAAQFQRELASLLRAWLLGLPAGIGLATLRATAKLALGVSPERSGVYSAGNGPAMRAALLGASVTDVAALPALVAASTRLTHTDPKAEYAALAVALVAWCQARGEPDLFWPYLSRLLPALPAAAELVELLQQAQLAAQRQESAPHFAAQLGLASGVTGYAYHTVPVALHICWRHRDLLPALQTAVECGGDTDTVAAIVGGIIGANGILPPSAWQAGVLEWTWTPPQLQQLARRVARAQEGQTSRVPYSSLARLPRNAMFTTVVLTHGFRRLGPPYH